MISVIVPVYKAEKYLHRCVDSILAQSYTDFELLLIDDGSPDNSGAICDEYAVKDSRVRVFHKENGGVSSARNLGLNNAQGEWITFVDSDDWIESDYFASFMGSCDADMIVCGVKSSDDFIWRTEDRIYTLKEFINQYNDDLIIRASWGGLLKNNIIKEFHIRFDTLMRYGEDMIFNLIYLSHCQNVRTLKFLGYNYYNPEGTVHSVKYNLSFDEIYYSLNNSVTIKHNLTKSIGVVFNLDADFASYLSMSPISNMDDKHYLNGYYNLCNRFDLTLNEESFYSHRLFSPIVRGISELKSLYGKMSYSRGKELYDVLFQINSGISVDINFKHKDFYVWNWLIKKKQFLLLDSLMKFYFFCKRKARGK